MKLLFRVSPDDLTAAYGRLKTLFRGHENMIFDAMSAAVASNNLPAFDLPAATSEYEQKHAEIESRLSKGKVRGQQTAISLMEEILRHVIEQGGVRGISNDDVIKCLYLTTSEENILLRLREQNHWAAEWTVKLNYKGVNESRPISVNIHSSTLGEITPLYVVEYINSAMYNYFRGMYATSIALLAIAVEATLRDILVFLNYSYSPRASSVDVYPYTTAKLKVEGTGYLLTFDNPLPRSVADFEVSTGGATEVGISIRRLIKPLSSGDRTDIYMLVPESVVDHLSVNIPSSPAQRSVSGLGAALRVIRYSEDLVSLVELPLDFEEVLTVVRNNLIHLSGEAMEKPLTMMDPSGDYKLKDFLDDDEAVFDFITSIPDFINGQYMKLKELQMATTP